jgi:tetratricopeptide (TPR) repeat protein
VPRRPRSHRLEDESRRVLAQVLEPRFLFRDESRDYGIDGEAEEFDESEHATGLRFLVQIKATDETEVSQALRVRVSAETATYYRALTLPVLMVRYLSEGQRLYVRWFHNPTRRQDPDTKTIAFHWTEDDLWVKGTAERLAAEARAFLSMRSTALPLPQPFALDSPPDVLGLSAAEIAIALRGVLARRPDVIEFVPEPRPDTARFRVAEEGLAVDMPGFTTATYSFDEPYDPGPGGEQLGVDLVALAAIGFERWGQDAVAARLATATFAESSLRGGVDAGVALAAAMARSRQIREALEVAQALDARDEPAAREMSFYFTLPALHHGSTLGDDELELYRATLRGRIDRRLELGEPVEAARNCIGLANSYRTRAQPAEAVEWYRAAVQYDPDYEERAHYWYELAGVLFGSHQYRESASAYRRAAELGSGPMTQYLEADALMFAGAYELALIRFDDADPRAVSFGASAEYDLKRRLLIELVTEFGLAIQERREDEALAAADVPEKAREDFARVRQLMAEAIRLDGLCALAWWNLAYADERLGEPAAAARHSTAAALCWEGDVESWANATILTWLHEVVELVPAIVVTGERMTGGALLPRLAERAREQGEAVPRAEFMEVLDSITEELSDEETMGYAVRVIGPDGTLKTVQMPSGVESE